MAFASKNRISMINRDKYLNQLIKKRHNGKIKIVTGIRRCGKSVLLNDLFYDYLINDGIQDNHIIKLSLEDASNAKYRNPIYLDEYIRSKLIDSDMYYIILDEIQDVVSIQNPWLENVNDIIGFPDVLLGLMKIKNVDIYVTGSNSKMLSSDVVTEFRDRGDEIHMSPLSFKEFYQAYKGDKEDTWREYYTYGGMPRILEFDTHEEKSNYLKNLFENTYLKDVMERHQIRKQKDDLDDLLNIIASSIGSLSNPSKLSKSFYSLKQKNIYPETIEKYLSYFKEAFIISEAKRYDVKGKKYLGSPLKYYFTDVGLRNAWLNFRQLEENHIMENIIHNELLARGFSVDVGVVEYRHLNKEEKRVSSQLEIDFIANTTMNTYYIQSALNIDSKEKKQQEINSLLKVKDSFTKIVVVKDHIMPYRDENGILYIGIKDFLLDEKYTN